MKKKYLGILSYSKFYLTRFISYYVAMTQQLFLDGENMRTCNNKQQCGQQLYSWKTLNVEILNTTKFP